MQMQTGAEMVVNGLLLCSGLAQECNVLVIFIVQYRCTVVVT